MYMSRAMLTRSVSHTNILKRIHIDLYCSSALLMHVTVAILAQGTLWAVAVTQAFLPRLDSHGPPFLDPFYPYGLGF